MTAANCTPATEPVSVAERDMTPDPYVDLLACLAGLIAANTSQRKQIEQLAQGAGPRAMEAQRLRLI